MVTTLRAALVSIAVLLAVGVQQATSDIPGPLPRDPSPSATFAQLVNDLGGGGASATDFRYRYLHKLDGHLQDVAASRLGGGTTASARIAAHREGIDMTSRGDVSVEVYVNGDVGHAADALRAIGMHVSATSDRAPQRTVDGWLPAGALANAAALGSTHAIVSDASQPSAGSVMSEGDGVIDGPAARALGPTGSGVSVGIISSTMDRVGGGIAQSQASGDLPAVVHDLRDDSQFYVTDEGRAMAEIVYDEAPGLSSVAFSTGEDGPDEKVSSIDSLVADGVRAIADDVLWSGQPFFQEGVIAQAVDRAKAAGVAYLVAAGNNASQGWEGTYAPVADPSGFSATTEDFDPGPAVDTVQTVGTIPGNQFTDLELQWAEPWGRATDDFAVDVYAFNGTTPVFAYTSDTNNIATGLPDEFVRIFAGASATKFAIAIRHVAGTGTPLLKFINLSNAGGTTAIEHPTNSGSITEAAAASGSLTIAAANYQSTSGPEAFSSRGPVTRLFDVNGNPLPAPEVRQKPDLAAPDRVSTSVPGFALFSGTSAAAPAAAGIAALIISAHPSMPVDEVYAIMTNQANAVDCPSAQGNPDVDCGIGFELADRAVRQALDSTPPVITASVSPSAPDGPNGWYHAPVTVTWSVSDTESPVVDPTGCGSVALADQAASLTCAATSAGGTTSVPLTIKRDSTPPTAPAITGIAAGAYVPATLPAAATIGCSSSDPTSSVDSCTVSGYSSDFGLHTLTAVGTNDAGLTSTTTLGYTVSKPAAIARLTLPKSVKLASFAKSGVTLSMEVASASTSLVVKLVAQVPKKKPGKGTRLTVLGTTTRRVAAGTVQVKLVLTPKQRLKLQQFAKATIKITIVGEASDATVASLNGSIIVRR